MTARHWLDSNGNWTTAADWTGGLVPGSTDDAVLDAGSYTVSEDASSTAPIGVHSIKISVGATLAITDVAGNKVGPGGVTNSGTLDVDSGYPNFNGEGGSSLTITGTLANTSTVQIGNPYLSAATTLTLGGLTNPTGASFLLNGSASHAAALVFSSGGTGFTNNGGNFELTYASPLTLGAAFTNSGTFGVHDDTTLKISGGFTNSGTLDVDSGYPNFNGEGGSSLTITGTLANTSTVQIGNPYLSAATTLTLGGLTNPTGASFLLNGSASHAVALVFSSGGTGFTNNGGNFELTYASPLTLGAAFTNSGTFGVHDDTTLKISGGFTNSGTLDVDSGYPNFNGEGGSSLTITGTLANTSTVQIGNPYLSAATTLTLGGLTNPTGASFLLNGSASHAVALVFSSGGTGFTNNGGNFELTYASPLTLGAAFTNSGTFGVHDDTTLKISGGFTNSGTLDVDSGYPNFNGEGGSSLTITGTLANTSTVQIGNPYLSAATTLTLGGLTNPTGASFLLNGSASHAVALVFSSGGTGFTNNGGNFELTYASPLTLGAAFTNSGTFGVHDDTTLKISGGFTNSGTLDVDSGYPNFNGEGGSSLTITGTLANTSTVQIGNPYLSAATTLTLGGLTNPTGASFLLNGSASHAAALVFSSGGTGFTNNGGNFELTYASPLTLGAAFTNSGTFGVHDDTTLKISGGFTNSGTLDVDSGYPNFNGEGGSSLTITGTLANTSTVQIGNPYLSAATTLTLGGLTNPTGASFLLNGSASHAVALVFSSGGTGFTNNGGNFELTYASPLTLGAAFTNSGTFGVHDDTTLKISGGFTNSGTLDVDSGYPNFNGEGGSSLTITGTLANTSTVQIGNPYLSAATTLTLGGLTNPTGASFLLNGSASHAVALVFSSGGTGFTNNGGNFELTYASPLTLGAAFTNSGTFGVHDDTTLKISGGFTNSGTLDVDSGYPNFNGEGGSSLTITGTLANTSTVQIGNPYLSAATTLTLGGLTNPTGASFLLNGSASHAAALTVSGPVSNAGSLNVGSFSVFDVTAGKAFTQTAGTTTVNGAFTAATIAIDGGTFSVDTTNFTNIGTMTAADGGKIDFSAGGLTNLSGTTLKGGTYVVDAGSTLQLPNNTTIVTLAANLTLSGTGSVMQSLDTSTSAEVTIESTLTTIAAGGALSVLGGRSYTTTDAITDSGSLAVGGGSTFTAAALNVAAGGKLLVDAGATVSLGSPLIVAGTATNAGSINGGGATAVTMAAGAGRLILDPGFAFGGEVAGDGKGSTLELAKGSMRGIVNALGTNFTNFGTVTVDAGATWTVEALASALSGATITGSDGANILALTSAGTVALAGVSQFPTINLAAGNNTVTVTDNTLSGGSVTIKDGASGNNSISAAGDTVASTGKTLTYMAGVGIDSFTGGFENDVVKVSAAAVGGDTLTGGSGANTLDLTSAGMFSLSGVSKFGTINLSAGNNTVTVTDNTLSGGSVTIKDGASGNNIVSAAGDTVASKGKTLTYLTGVGTDSFTGGFENDVVKVSAAVVGGDTLTGGSGANTLDLTSAGMFSLSGVSKFGTINLVAGNNTVTVADNTLSGGSVTIKDGASGNNIVSAAADTVASAGKSLTYITGSGTDSFTGGFENDVVELGALPAGVDILIGGRGTNRLILTTAGTFSLPKVSDFGPISLAAGNNKIAVTDTALSGESVTIKDGASGNNIVSASSDTAASKGKALTYVTGVGTDSFTGGFENDVVKVSAAVVGGDTLTGGSGANTLDLTTAGTFSLSRVSKFGTINLAAGNNKVTVADNTLSGGSVTIRDGASGNNIVSASSDTAGSKGKTLTYVTGVGTDTLTGGFENDVVKVSAAVVGGDTLTGGSSANTLDLTSAGMFSLSGVSKFGTINLVAGNNTVTVADNTLSGGSVTIRNGASGNNIVSATADTVASMGKKLTYIASGSGSDTLTGGFENDVVRASGDSSSSVGQTLTLTAGSGTDTLTGGFENDVVKVSAAAVDGDTLTGGSGTNRLILTTAGTLSLSGVSGFETYVLGNGGPNSLTLTNANFAGVSGASITIFGGSGGNTISEAGVTATDAAVLEGGSGADTLIAGQSAVIIGGAGADAFELTTPGSLAAPDMNTVADFTHGTDKIAFSEAGFGLGPKPVAATLFSANPTGSFTTAAQRFAYNSTSGALYFDADGSGGASTPLSIATLNGHPTLAASDLFFVA